MFKLFKKEIIWGLISFILAMIYLLLDEGGRCVLFIAISIYVSGKFADYFIGEHDNESNIFSHSGVSIMDTIYCNDSRPVRETNEGNK